MAAGAGANITPRTKAVNLILRGLGAWRCFVGEAAWHRSHRPSTGAGTRRARGRNSPPGPLPIPPPKHVEINLHRGVPGTPLCRNDHPATLWAPHNGAAGQPSRQSVPVHLSQLRRRPPACHRRGRTPLNYPPRDHVDGATLENRNANGVPVSQKAGDHRIRDNVWDRVSNGSSGSERRRDSRCANCPGSTRQNRLELREHRCGGHQVPVFDSHHRCIHTLHPVHTIVIRDPNHHGMR